MIEVYTPSQPVSKPVPFQPTNPTLLDLVNRAITAYPAEEMRIRRGAEIVERDGVRVREDGMYLVGIFHFYPVNGHCPCADRAPEGRCKHRFAKTFYRQLHAVASVRSLHFYASLHGTVGGVAQVFEDGRILFVEHDTQTVTSCTLEHIVLGGRKDLIDAARQSA